MGQKAAWEGNRPKVNRKAYAGFPKVASEAVAKRVKELLGCHVVEGEDGLWLVCHPNRGEAQQAIRIASQEMSE